MTETPQTTNPFTFTGRVSGAEFFNWGIGYTVYFSIINIFSFYGREWILILLLLPALWIFIAVTVKRFHDFNTNGKYAVFLCLSAIAGVFSQCFSLEFLLYLEFADEKLPPAGPIMVIGSTVFVALSNLFYFSALGAIPSINGQNKYGDKSQSLLGWFSFSSKKND